MNFYKKHLEDYKSQYMAYIPLSIILQSCIGSVAAMYILINNDFQLHSYIQLTLCVIVTMLFNAAVLAQLKYSTSFNFLLLSLIVNSVLITINVALFA
jgi:hypothetical protein